MLYLLVSVCSKEDNAATLAEEHLERHTSCTHRRTMVSEHYYLLLGARGLFRGGRHHANPSLEQLPSRDSLQTVFSLQTSVFRPLQMPLQGWWEPLELHRHWQSSSVPCDLTSCL